jgi:predicted secreted acid phosphatase
MLYTNKVKKYIESGRYEKDIRSLTQKAKAIVNYEILTNPRPKTVIIDIDETLLSNLTYIKEQENLNDVDQLCAWQSQGLCQPIQPMVDLYLWLLQKPVEVVFITARALDLEKATLNNFNQCQLPLSKTIFRDPLKWPVPKKFKTEQRRLISEAGSDIILNIGDQPTDFEGGYWKQALKVHNPFYIESKLPWQKHIDVAA